MPSEKYGKFRFYTINDILEMYWNAKMSEDFSFQIKNSMLEMAHLTEKYARMLYEYDWMYEDDRK